MTAAMKVVTLASTTVASARAKPESSDCTSDRPVPPLLAHALVDDDVGVDRHAHGQHDAGDAGHGQRRAEDRQDGDDQRDVGGEREVGDQAEPAIGDEHEADDENAGDDRGDLAGRDRIGAEARADGALLDDGQVGRQRAGAQQDGKVVGALGR